MEHIVVRDGILQEHRVSTPRVRQLVLTDGIVNIACFARVHRQNQRHDTVAALSCLSIESIVTALGAFLEYRVSPFVWQLVLTDGQLFKLC